MEEYYVQAKRMSVGYHGKSVLEHVEIALKKGEILTIIGPNGAGKSTILKSIARQLKLLAGTVYIGKEELHSMDGEELAKKLAVMFTERLHTELMTCEEVVATGRYPYTGRFGILSEEDWRIVAEAMELVQVDGLANRDFREISDGQRQRVMLARAICQEPEVLLLDEPTSFLDVKYKLEFLSVLQKLKKKKKLTVILSLHELELAQCVSDKILCVSSRGAERVGTPEEIFAQGYIRELFGIQTGSYDEETGSMELEAPDGAAKIFVLAGGGSGRAVYRSLQREGIPFATGIIGTNDLDYPTAKALAAAVIAQEAFEPVTEETLCAAKACMDACEKVLCCRAHFGSLEAANKELFAYAKTQGKQMCFPHERRK